MFHERHHRTFLKSVTWLLIAFGVTFLILLLIQDDWKKGAVYALVIQIIKFVFFYLHERVWNKTNFGQQLKVK